ncbi:MAG: gliding motility lipoprotein GldB [Candidatus Amoebophilus sp.]
MRKLTTTALILLASILGLYILYSVLSQPRRINPTGISISLEIKRLEDSLFNLRTKSEIAMFLEQNQLLVEQFFGLESDQEKTQLIDKLYDMISNTSLQELYQEVQHKFKDITKLQSQLEYAFKCLKYYYPTFEVPQVVTFITGMGSDLYVSKQLIVISLDFFLGEGAKFRPLRMPDYILRTYQPQYILPKLILLLSQQFNIENPKDNTLLHDMLYAGKAYYFTKTLLPEVSHDIMLGYTKEQYSDTEKHQRIVWQHFIDHALFYETNHMVKKKYLDDRPFTSEIGYGCPGNIGGWLGYQIIKKYMQNNRDITLPVLMKNTDAQHLFTQAKYKPK